MLTEKGLSPVFIGPCGLRRQRPATWLRVEGPDATTFLQGQCTQDLRTLVPGQTAWALWLSIKGKVLAETLVLCDRAADGAEAWCLWSADGVGAALRERLEEFLIADDVTLTDEAAATAESPGWEHVTLAGPEAQEWLQTVLASPASPPAEGEWRQLDGGCVFAGRRGQAGIWEWLRPVEEAGGSARLSPPALPPLRAESLVLARVRAGVPAIPAEFGPADLPQEAGLDSQAISFSKGCYLGQEVMARLHAMGRVRRRLLRVAGNGPVPAAGGQVCVGGETKSIGELRVAVDDGGGGWLGLAMIQLLGLDPNRPLELLVNGAPDRARTVTLIDELTSA